MDTETVVTWDKRKAHAMHRTGVAGEYIYRGWEVSKHQSWNDPVYWTGSDPNNPESEDGQATGDCRVDVRQQIDEILDREGA